MALIVRDLPPALRASLPARAWSWRDRAGNHHTPADMETRHLHNTLRMIWNNFMPPEMRVGAVRLYSFGPSYSVQYLREAILRIWSELRERDDMSAQQKRELSQMRDHMQRDDSQLVQERLR